MDAENRWWVAELLAADCEKARVHIQDGKTPCRNGMLGWRKRKRRMRKVKMEEMHQQTGESD